ncbi:Transcription factor TFIIIB component B [Ceratobasidium sp. 394]|nr:Transcription factor TFIIIB component B [Ceratobasidium sp. 394]
MAGGHASSRVESGSMKFRPAVASNRRPILSTPSRSALSSNSVASTPSKRVNPPTRPSASHGLASSSDTEGPASTREKATPLATPRAATTVSITPGITRLSSNHPGATSNIVSAHAGSSASGLVLATPQVQSRTIIPGSTRSAVSELSTPRNTSLRGSFIKPVPRPVFVAPPSRPPTNSLDSTGLQHAITTTHAPLPPNPQISHHNAQPVPGPSTPRAPPQIEQLHNTPGIGLPIPPPVQTAPTFPLDPALGGTAIQDNDPILSQNGPFAQDVYSAIDVPGPVEPQTSIVAPPATIGADEMPPPPPLPPIDEEEESNEVPTGEGQSEAESSAPPKKRRRRAARTTKDGQPRKRKKTSRSQEGSTAHAEDNDDEEASEQPKRKRGRKAGGGGRKVTTLEDRIGALERHAAEAMEGALGEPLDPTNATMASLCETDLPNGRISSKFLEKGIAYVKHVEDRRQRILERTAERLKKLRASGLDPDDPQQPPPIKKPEPTPAPDSNNNPLAGPSNSRRELGASLSPSPEPRVQPAETFAESAAAPQIRFVNGEMVLDEDSQFYDRAAATRQDEDAMVVVDEADSTRFSNSASFARREGARGARWSADETEMFYWCLSAFGEDYENIARYLGRTPGQCKNKTKAEDRKGNEKRITMAIKTRIPLDLEEFGRITGRDFSGPPPEIRAPTVPPPAERPEQQEPVMVGAKVKATSSAPTTPRKKDKAPVRDGEEEIMTLEEYERDGKDD